MSKKHRAINFGQAGRFSLVCLAVVWGLSLTALINMVMLGEWMKVGLALAALILYLLPVAAEIKCKVRLSAVMEITYYLFIFASLILGEVFAFYGKFPFWDNILHFLSGFALAGVGYAIVQALGGDKMGWPIKMVFGFCFAMTLGVLWECVEFSFDMVARTDAQKDTQISEMSSFMVEEDWDSYPTQLDDIVRTDIHLGDGEVVTVEGGYIDIGLLDTMKDIFVNMGGALTFAVLGGLSARRGQKSKIAGYFVPVKG